MHQIFHIKGTHSSLWQICLNYAYQLGLQNFTLACWEWGNILEKTQILLNPWLFIWPVISIFFSLFFFPLIFLLTCSSDTVGGKSDLSPEVESLLRTGWCHIRGQSTYQGNTLIAQVPYEGWALRLRTQDFHIMSQISKHQPETKQNETLI